MRKGDLQARARRIRFRGQNSRPTAEPLHPSFNRARVLTYRKQYDAALADFAEAQKIDPDGPQVATYRCITYTEMGKFDEALADCNAALAQNSDVGLRADQPRQCLSRKGRPRRCAEGLQCGAQDQSEQCPRPRRPRPGVRKAPRRRRRARRISFGERRADEVRRDRYRDCAPHRQGAPGGADGRARRLPRPIRLREKPPHPRRPARARSR